MSENHRLQGGDFFGFTL